MRLRHVLRYRITGKNADEDKRAVIPGFDELKRVKVNKKYRTMNAEYRKNKLQYRPGQINMNGGI